MKISKKKRLDYVLKNIPAKVGDDQSILGQRKLGMMKRDRQTDRDFFFTR